MMILLFIGAVYLHNALAACCALVAIVTQHLLIEALRNGKP
jgi:hypothetical protein